MDEEIDFEAACAACTYYQKKFPKFFIELERLSQLPEFRGMKINVHREFCVRYCPISV